MYLYYITYTISIGTILFYSITVLFYFHNFFPKKRGYRLILAIGGFLIVGLFVLANHINAQEIGMILLIFLCFFFLKALYIITISKSLLCALIMVLIFLVFRGLWVAFFSILTEKTLYLTLSNPVRYNVIIITAILSSVVFGYVVTKTYAPIKKMKLLFNNYNQQKFLLSFSVFLFINIMFVSDGENICVYSEWFSKIYIESFLLMLIFFILASKNAIKVSGLIESEIRTSFLEEQLDRQLQHYQAYQKHTESFRAFKHDYKNMITSIKILLDNKEFAKARLILDNIHDMMSKEVLITNSYSNNLIVDAILFEAATRCESKSIKFSARVFIDSAISIGDLNLARIFFNLIDNAIEAASKVEDIDGRFFYVTSRPTNNGWMLVEFKNSYAGKLKISNNKKFLSTKKNSEMHGLGIEIISNILEENHGMLEIDVTSEKNVFITRLFFSNFSKAKEQ